MIHCRYLTTSLLLKIRVVLETASVRLVVFLDASRLDVLQLLEAFDEVEIVLSVVKDNTDVVQDTSSLKYIRERFGDLITTPRQQARAGTFQT